jgi:hypothetical protein
MLVGAWQFGLGDHPTHSSLLPAVLALVGAAIVGGGFLILLERIIPRLRQAIRARRSRRRQLHAAATSEVRSRAQMDELCPYGWQAQITVYSSAAELPPDAPNPERTRVALDWSPLGPGSATFADRRVWAESVLLALEAMVVDRVTDETLQDIEARALADGAEWPDP